MSKDDEGVNFWTPVHCDGCVPANSADNEKCELKDPCDCLSGTCMNPVLKVGYPNVFNPYENANFHHGKRQNYSQAAAMDTHEKILFVGGSAMLLVLLGIALYLR